MGGTTDGLPPRADSGETVRLSDLLASATYRRAIAIELPCGGTLYVRNWQGYIGLRTNRHGALCWHRRVRKDRLLSIAERGVDAGHSVRVEDVDELLPKRYREIPSKLAPEEDG